MHGSSSHPPQHIHSPQLAYVYSAFCLEKKSHPNGHINGPEKKSARITCNHYLQTFWWCTICNEHLVHWTKATFEKPHCYTLDFVSVPSGLLCERKAKRRPTARSPQSIRSFSIHHPPHRHTLIGCRAEPISHTATHIRPSAALSIAHSHIHLTDYYRSLVKWEAWSKSPICSRPHSARP